MSTEPPFHLVDTEPAREKAQRLFERVRRSIVTMLPSDADIRHIGATAVSGCLTKGDLDIVVRVPGMAFQQADALLARHFTRNDGSIRTASFSAFEDASTDPHLGIQLTMIGGPHDFFHLFVEALRRSPHLVSEYNTLTLLHEGSDMTVYRRQRMPSSSAFSLAQARVSDRFGRSGTCASCQL
jgi:GrpB-like predicted nucleotidyltransferase (UPF0157 family)